MAAAGFDSILPEFSWKGTGRHAGGTVQVYFDVSGSMDAELRFLVPLLAEFLPYIRTPLWAFSTVVSPARIVRGQLQCETTSGTSLTCVFEHLQQSRPRKALIITDGYVESGAVQQHPCCIEAIIPACGTEDLLAGYGIPVHRLPAFS